MEEGAKNPLLMKDMLRQKQNRKKYLLDQRLGVLFRVKTSGNIVFPS